MVGGNASVEDIRASPRPSRAVVGIRAVARLAMRNASEIPSRAGLVDVAQRLQRHVVLNELDLFEPDQQARPPAKIVDLHWG